MSFNNQKPVQKASVKIETKTEDPEIKKDFIFETYDSVDKIPVLARAASGKYSVILNTAFDKIPKGEFIVIPQSKELLSKVTGVSIKKLNSPVWVWIKGKLDKKQVQKINSAVYKKI
jgi:hypothetical protein